MTSLVASAKISTGNGAAWCAEASTAALAMGATCLSEPVAMQRLPAKAVHGVSEKIILMSG
jgi:hypothetical protein